MTEEWRSLLYPLGFLSALAFGLRFLVQWLTSEFQQRSVVVKSFWRISLTGNLLLLTHSLVQAQVHICLIQVCSAVIAWRNLDLMQTRHRQGSLKQVSVLMAASIVATMAVFSAINIGLSERPTAWMRIPRLPWHDAATPDVNVVWHIIGLSGVVLFSLRFWMQWWTAERRHASALDPSFWWISLVGAMMSMLYFWRIRDPVNLIGPVVGVIPYIRNLMLIRKRHAYT